MALICNTCYGTEDALLKCKRGLSIMQFQGWRVPLESTSMWPAPSLAIHVFTHSVLSLHS